MSSDPAAPRDGLETVILSAVLRAYGLARARNLPECHAQYAAASAGCLAAIMLRAAIEELCR